MIKALIVLIILALSASVAVFGDNGEDKKEILNVLPVSNTSIVRLHRVDGPMFCSAVVVDSNTIVTAAHCVDGLEELVSVRAADGVDIGVVAVVSGARAQNDLATLTGDFTKLSKRKIIVSPAVVLSRIFDQKRKLIACGYPYGGKLFCTPLSKRETLGFQITSIGNLYPGMSGGPVLDVKTGDVVGINSAMYGGLAVISPTLEIFSSLGIAGR